MKQKNITQVGNIVVYEILKRQDGSAMGIGASFEVSEAEAAEMIFAGTHKLLNAPLGNIILEEIEDV